MAVTALSVAISCSRSAGSTGSLVTMPEVMIITEGFNPTRYRDIRTPGSGTRLTSSMDGEGKRKDGRERNRLYQNERSKEEKTPLSAGRKPDVERRIAGGEGRGSERG